MGTILYELQFQKIKDNGYKNGIVALEIGMAFLMTILVSFVAKRAWNRAI